MAEASSGIGERGGAPLPPKRPTLIRAAPTRQNNGESEQRAVPPRPVPPVPGNRPAIPPLPATGLYGSNNNLEHHHKHIHKLDDGGPPHLPAKPSAHPNLLPPPPPKPVHSNKGAVRKRPEITVVGARPMSEVGFRSENNAKPSNSNEALEADPPPLPKRDASLQNESRQPQIPNKPLPPAPSSKQKIPSRPSQPPKTIVTPKPTKQPEVDLLIDFSDEIHVQSQPLIPLPSSNNSQTMPEPSSMPPPLTMSPPLTTPPALSMPPDESMPQSSSMPSLVPSQPSLPVPKPRPIPAARSRSPAPITISRSPTPVTTSSESAPPSVPPKNLPPFPQKPDVPVIKPRKTPDKEIAEEMPTRETSPSKEAPKYKRPTIIRVKKKEEPILKQSPSEDAVKMGLPPTRPKPPTPAANRKIPPISKGTEDLVEPEVEYAVVNKTNRPAINKTPPTEETSKVPPPLPPKAANPAPAPKPIVLPKPRTSLKSTGTEISPEESSVMEASKPEETNSNVTSGVPQRKPTIIRAPPKPMRLHDVEGQAKQKLEIEDDTKLNEEEHQKINTNETFDDTKTNNRNSSAPPRPAARRPFSVIGAPVTRVEEPETKMSDVPKTPPARPAMKCTPKSKSVEKNEEMDMGSQKSLDEIKIISSEERGPPRPKPPSPKTIPSRVKTDEDVIKRPNRPPGIRSRPMSAAPNVTIGKDKEKPSRPQPLRPSHPKQEKPTVPPSLPPRPGPSHILYHYILTYPHGIAEHNYSASKDDELSFKEGDTIILVERIDSQWLKGKIGNKEGVFPENYINIIHPLHSELPQPGSSPDSATGVDWTKVDWGEDEPDADITKIKPDTGSGPRCRARFDFEGEGHGDLDFEEGDIIQLRKRVGSDWLEGELNNKVGIFPLSFVEIIEDIAEDKPADESEGSHLVKAVFDFEGLGGELSFQAGESIHVIGEVNSEWLYGETGGRQGKFPATFVDHKPSHLPTYQPDNISTSSSTSSLTKSPAVLFTCKAMYDYNSPEEEDLNFHVGDQIQVIEDQGDWLKGLLNNKQGVFPKSFVQIEKHEGSGNKGQAKALYDFDGEGDNELTFKYGYLPPRTMTLSTNRKKLPLYETRKNDVILLDELVSGTTDWQWGSLSGKRGMFPTNFVEVIS